MVLPLDLERDILGAFGAHEFALRQFLSLKATQHGPGVSTTLIVHLRRPEAYYQKEPNRCQKFEQQSVSNKST